jgi:hypothetical protein
VPRFWLGRHRSAYRRNPEVDNSRHMIRRVQKNWIPYCGERRRDNRSISRTDGAKICQRSHLALFRIRVPNSPSSSSHHGLPLPLVLAMYANGFIYRASLSRESLLEMVQPSPSPAVRFISLPIVRPLSTSIATLPRQSQNTLCRNPHRWYRL